MSLLEETYWGNTVQDWLLALVMFFVVLTALRIVKGVVGGRLHEFAQKTSTRVDNMISDLIRGTRLFFVMAVAAGAAKQFVDLGTAVNSYLNVAIVVFVFLQLALWGNVLIQFLVTQYFRLEAKEDEPHPASSAALTFIGRLILWSILFLLALDNLNVEITALVASMGIGGIAIALAVQNILGDLFASLSILLDKPFELGDFIIVGDLLGTVEKIGLKTTRVRALSGEQVVFSNTDLLSCRVRNFKRMYERRIVFEIGVIYQTSYENLAEIPGMIRDIIEALPDLRFDRAHFKEYGDSSLNFEVVYFVQSPDFGLYMDRQQSINLELFRRFGEKGIEFAYPTRTLFVNQETPVPAAAS